MTSLAIDTWSSTPGSNNAASPNGAPEGMPFSGVNDTIRQVMACIRGIWASPTAGGTANAITITLAPAFSSLSGSQGIPIWFIPASDNTGATTISVNGLTATAVQAAGAALLGHEIIAGRPACAMYDGTVYQLLNPKGATGSFTGTGTGFSGTAPTATIDFVTTADKSHCTLHFGTGLSGTSNATTFTVTGMPTGLIPARTQSYYATVVDSGSTASGSIIFTASSATITFDKGAAIGTGPSAFTASGTKAFSNATGASGTDFSVTFALR